jgi:hypothetical protein
MFSVTSTGMCCRPLWTAIVRPTMSGMIIERRDQVLIGLRSLLAAASPPSSGGADRRTDLSSVNEAWQIPLTNAVLTALHDHVARAFVAAGS